MTGRGEGEREGVGEVVRAYGPSRGPSAREHVQSGLPREDLDLARASGPAGPPGAAMAAIEVSTALGA